MKIIDVFREQSKLSLLVKIVVPVAFFVLLWAAQASLAEIDTWKRNDFIPLVGNTITGFSESGLTRLEHDTELLIPEGITTISDHAFQDYGITSVEFPDTLEIIGSYAFAANSITQVNLEDTQIATVSANAFRDNRLQSVSLPYTCTTVEENAFVNNVLDQVVMDNVTTIGPKAFANNRLSRVNLPAIVAIDPSAFDANGRVVAISTPHILDSHFSGGSGYIINPVTIRVQYLNVDTGAPFRSTETLGTDFTSDNLYPSGVDTTVHAPHLTGWHSMMPTSYTETVTEGQTFTFTYRSVIAAPVIIVTSRIVELGDPAITQAMALSWVTARSGVDNAVITDITVTAAEPFPIQTDVERDVHITYRVVDAFGNIGNKTITAIITPGLLYQSLGNGWQYIDFFYGGQPGTGTFTDPGWLLGLRDDLPGYGVDKYNNDNNRDLVLPGINPYTGQSLTRIIYTDGSWQPTITRSKRHFANGQYNSIDFSKMTDLEVIGDNAFFNSPITTLDLSNNKALTTIGTTASNVTGRTFRSALLTSLDLSNNPELTVIGHDAFLMSPLTSLKIAQNDKDLTIGASSFRDAQLTALDLSGRTGAINMLDNLSNGLGAFINSPLVSLKIGPSSKQFHIGQNTFRNAKLTELDLSGRTGSITLGSSVYGGGAFYNSPLTSLKIGPSSSQLTIGSAAFYSAKLTELDLSGRTGAITLGAGTFDQGAFRTSPLRRLAIGPSDASLNIGEQAFRDTTQLTELDLSGRTGAIAVRASAFYSAPLVSLKIGPSGNDLIIDRSAFKSAKLTELDLSGRTGIIKIGADAGSEVDDGAFFDSLLTSLKIGPSASLLHIGRKAFQNARLTELDLSGRTGPIMMGQSNYSDSSSFRNSPLTSLKIGPSSSYLTIHAEAFLSARLTELDLSGRTGPITLGSPFLNSGDQGVFRNSPLTSLKIGGADASLTIGQNAFREARLTELDLSGRTRDINIGNYSSITGNTDQGAFLNSPLTSLKIGGSGFILNIGINAFANARLTELDLSGRTGIIKIGLPTLTTAELGVFRNSPLTSLKIGPGDSELTIGLNAFLNAQLNELDLSGRTSTITIGSISNSADDGAFRNSPLTSLKVGEGQARLVIGVNAFREARLTELDLSGRTSSIQIGSPSHTFDKGAFRNAPLTSLKIGPSAYGTGINNELTIGMNAFLNAQLSELDLSGRKGYVTLGSTNSNADEGVFRNSPLASLKFGPSHPAAELFIGVNAFREARLTELDLSMWPGRVYIGSPNPAHNDEGAFRNSPITSLKFGTPAAAADGIQIGTNAFYNAILSSLDLSENPIRIIGNKAFYNSLFDSLVIGRLNGTLANDRDNLYQHNGVVPGDYRIVGYTDELPITILQDISSRNMLPKVPGYVLNPLLVTIRYVDQADNELWPSRKITLQYPFDGDIKAQPLYGYAPDAFVRRLTIATPATPQIMRETITFTYTPFDPTDLGYYEYAVIQQTPKPFDLIGNILISRFDLITSWPDSQDPFDDSGFIARVYYDPAYIVYDNHTPPRDGGTEFTVVNDPVMGILSFTFPSGTEPGDVGPDIWWRLVPGYTQEYTKYPIHVQYEDPTGNVYAVANEVGLSGYYLRPRYQKTTNDYYGDVVVGGNEYARPLDPTMTYNFNLLHPNPHSGGTAIPRWMEGMVITDVLPTYTTLMDGVTTTGVRAIFDPTKNPGWSLLADGITLEYVYSYSFVGSANIGRLVLDFPNAKPNTSVFNTVDVSMDPLNPGQFEGSWTGSTFVSSWFYPRYRYIEPPGWHYTDKRPVNYGDRSVLIRWNGSPESFENSAGWFAGGELDVRPEIAWALTFGADSLATGAYYNNITFKDHSLDDRLQYVGVDTGTLGPCSIRAFDVGGNVIHDVGPINGRYDFPAGIRADITSIEFYGSDKTILSLTSSLRTYVFTEFIDPTVNHIDHPVVLEGGRRFENRFTVSAQVGLGDDSHVFTYTTNRLAAVYMRDLIATIGINKTQSLPDAVVLQDDLSLDYLLYLDHFDETNRQTSSNYYSTTVQNFKITDMLPNYYEFEAFIPSAALVNATTNLKWRTVSEGFIDKDGVAHDTLEITADTFAIGNALELGRISGRLAPWIKPDAQLRNYVYLVADDKLDVRYGGRITTSANDFGGIDNPFGRIGIPMSETSVLVSATRELVARKFIRAMNDDGSWKVWSSTGVRTEAGASFQYRLSLYNYTNYNRYDIDFVDVLPVTGDMNITLPNNGIERIPRDSAFSNTLEDVTVPQGYRWQFITTQIPTDYGNGTPQNADVWFDAQTWIDGQTASSAQRAEATALRIASATVPSPLLERDKSLEVVITMKAQEDGFAYAEQRAWNSFAFRNTFDLGGVAQTRQYQQPNAVFNEIAPKPARIELRKRAGTSGSTYLGGAVFELYRVTDTGLAYVKSATSAPSTGLVVFDAIERDNYVIREVVPPAGYVLNLADIEVRYDQFTDGNGVAEAWSYNAGIVDNTLAPTYGDLIIEKKDANGVLAPGILFVFTPPANSGLSPFTRTTDDNGRIVLNHILTGTWTVAEITAPGNLRPISFQVVVGATATTGPSNQTPANPTTSPTTSLVVRTAPITFTVNNAVAQVTLHKIGVLSDSAWNTSPTSIDPNGHTSLNAVRFELYRVNSNVKGGAGTLISNNVTTGSNGQISYSPLKAGQLYYYLESATQPTAITTVWDLTTQDPTLESRRHYFWIDENGRLYNGNPYHAIPDEDIPAGQTRGVLYDFNRVVIKNKQRDRNGYLSIEKFDWSKDADGNVLRRPLENVAFVVEREDALTGLWIFQKELITDENGRIGPELFRTGTYRFFEKETVDGYLTDNTIRRFTVNSSVDNQMFTFSIDNVAVTPTLVKGNIVGVYSPSNATDLRNLNAAYEYLKDQGLPVHKMVNSVGHVELLVGLGGAEFTVKEYAGLTDDAPLINIWTEVTSDADGTFMLDGLIPLPVFKEGHTYTFQETQAPAGFAASDRIVSYQPRSEAESIRASGGRWIAFDNRALRHRIVVSKYASDTRRALAGATFELLHPDKTPVFPGRTFISNSSGLIEFEDLVPGVYYLREISAPEGYVATDNVVYRFVVMGEMDFILHEILTYPDLFILDEDITIKYAGSSASDHFWILYNDPVIPDASLTIEKNVAGADKSGSFDFRVSRFNEDGEVIPYSLVAYTLFEEGATESVTRITDTDGVITLSHGQRAIIYGVQIGVRYHVEEINVEGYLIRVLVTDDQGESVSSRTHEVELTISGNDTIRLTNSKSFFFPLTGGPGMAATIVTALILAASALGAAIGARRKRA